LGPAQPCDVPSKESGTLEKEEIRGRVFLGEALERLINE